MINKPHVFEQAKKKTSALLIWFLLLRTL